MQPKATHPGKGASSGKAMNMNRAIIKRYNTLLSFLLSLLGFGAACSIGGCEYGSPAVEYGTPHAMFKVNGNVKSEVRSENIPGIRVVMEGDTAYTDAQGNYRVGATAFPVEQIFLIEFRDVDGERNGAYQPLDTVVVFTDPEFNGGDGGWFDGETETEFNVELKDGE